MIAKLKYIKHLNLFLNSLIINWSLINYICCFMMVYFVVFCWFVLAYLFHKDNQDEGSMLYDDVITSYNIRKSH